MAVAPTGLPELVVSDDGTKTAFNFRGVIVGCKDLIVRIAGNADVEFPVSGLLISDSDARLSDARTADAIKTLNEKAISAAADPTTGQALIYDGTDWHPANITAVALKTLTAKNISAAADPSTNQGLVYDGSNWKPITIVLDSDSRLTNDRTANAIRTSAVHNLATTAPQTNYGLVFNGTTWEPILIVRDTDSRLTNDRTANALRTSASHSIDTGAPAAGHVLTWRASDSKWASKLPADYRGGPFSPTGTTSTSGVMMGIGGSITPTCRTRMLFCAFGTISATGQGAVVNGYYGTGTAPSNGASPTGNSLIGGASSFASPAPPSTPFAIVQVVNNLTVGTTYWLDLALLAVTSGTATVSLVGLSAVEL